MPEMEADICLSPDGLFAPGYADLGRYFDAMWKDASRNRETSGCKRHCEYRDAETLINLANLSSWSNPTSARWERGL